MKTTKREVAVLWRASKIFEYLIQRGDDPADYVPDDTMDGWRRFTPAGIVYGLDMAHDRMMHTPIFCESNWEILWKYAEIEMQSFDENIASLEPTHHYLVTTMFRDDN